MAALEQLNARKSQTDHTRLAYQNIRQMLFHDEIGPGQKISIRDLAVRFGMSTTPVVQALRWLEIQGLVAREHNKGYYTEPISLKQVKEIYDLRELVEVSLLPETISRLDEKGITRLYTAHQAHIVAARESSLNEKLIKDMELHLTLASLSDCFIQQMMLKNLFEFLYLKYRGSYFFHEKPMVADAHKGIIDAVVARDLPTAQGRLSQHIRKVKDMALDELGKTLKDRETLVL